MKHQAIVLTLLAGFAAAPAIYAADPNSPDTSSSARQTAHDAKNTVKGAASDTGEFLSDSAITTKVKASLLTEKNLKSLGIDVDTKEGVVTLSGKVPSTIEKKQAEDVTRHVKGVKDVKNDLALKAG
jgi:osmotically-inducible protein OsmY